MSQILSQVEMVLAKKDEMSNEMVTYLVGKVAVDGISINHNIIDTAINIDSRSDKSKRTRFVDFAIDHPSLRLASDESILNVDGDLVTIKTDRSSAVFIENIKIIDGRRVHHGEYISKYSNGDHSTSVWKDGQCQSSVRYDSGLTTYIKYDENENEVSRTFGQFDHLPGGTETPFMQFQKELAEKIADYISGKTSTVQLYQIPKCAVFYAWTREFAKSNGFTISDFGQHLTIKK
jgi:hypothetical protein